MLATVFVSVGGRDEVLRVWGSFVILKGFGFLALVLWGCSLAACGPQVVVFGISVLGFAYSLR